MNIQEYKHYTVTVNEEEAKTLDAASKFFSDLSDLPPEVLSDLLSDAIDKENETEGEIDRIVSVLCDVTTDQLPEMFQNIGLFLDTLACVFTHH